jgi:hypothetical protein
MHRPSFQSTEIFSDQSHTFCKNAWDSTDWFDFTRSEATLQLTGTTRPVATARFDDATPSEITPPANSPDWDLTNALLQEMIECVHVAEHTINNTVLRGGHFRIRVVWVSRSTLGTCRSSGNRFWNDCAWSERHHSSTIVWGYRNRGCPGAWRAAMPGGAPGLLEVPGRPEEQTMNETRVGSP